MFGLLTRTSPSRKPLARRTTRTLSLERLEDRLSPSGGGGGGTAPVGSVAPPPETITLSVVYDPNRQATFSGQLTNQFGPVADQTINLTGVVNATASTNGQGAFDVTLSIPKLGTEHAASANGQCNTARFTLVAGNPTISNFTAVSEGSGMWLLSGTVSGAPTQGEAVNFGGITALQGQSTGVNSNGTFEFYAIINSGQGGWASAQAVDWWGDTSQTAADYVGA